MSEKEKKQNRSGVTRRDFFKSAGVVAGGTAIGVGALPVMSGNMFVKKVAAAQPDSNNKFKFETPPPPVPESEVKEVLDTDVVVLGAGIGGMCAAISAVESGAKVVMLEKKKAYTANGGWNGAIGSRLQKKMGINIDRDEIIAEFMRWSAFKADQKIISLWADNSGTAMDWILDMTDAAGVISTIESDLRKGGDYHHYKTGHLFMNQDENVPPGNHFLLPVLEANAKNKGVDIRYKTPAEQVIRDENGRVAGVIAKTKAGYIRINAKKAVILATGGFQNNPEMLAKYIPDTKNAAMIWTFPPKCTGDGHQMAMWIGAEMEEPLYHCPMYFDGGIPMAGMISIVRQPWLNVNILGERFVNEDAPFGYTCRADMRQPGHTKWVVFDAKYLEDAPELQGNACERIGGRLSLHNPKDFQGLLKRDIAKEAGSLEELATKMEIPCETFNATVKRYNELCDKGKDPDFGKDPSMLIPIKKAPFYAVKTGAALVVTCSGLKINTDLQVLDAERKIIPGLYAVGDTTGGFFSNDYPHIMGAAHGRALTFGYLAGKTAAKEKV